MITVLQGPLDVVPDLSTRGALERYTRLRDAGFTVDQATTLADAGYDVLGHVRIGGGS